MQREHHEPAFRIEERAVMRLATIVSAFPAWGAVIEVAEADVDSRRLILFLDEKKAVIDRVIEGKPSPRARAAPTRKSGITSANAPTQNQTQIAQ